MPALKVAKEAFKQFMNVRETVAFYMFIIEESIQAVGMACYLYKKYGLNNKAKETAQWCINELIDPLLDFSSSIGVLAYPLNLAYSAFAEATRKVMEMYLELPEQPPEQS